MSAPLKPELLAPAGDWECLNAAIENGADAIYFGLEKFNARMRAQNFTLSDLPKVMETLRLRGVRGYVTFNTLVFPGELQEAESFLRACAVAGVDGLIIQDIGILKLAQEVSPDLPLHASTQMTVTDAEGINLAKQLGCSVVVLARELSLRDLEKIRRDIPIDSIPLEMFVHGALCVAYSGQCLTSESLGGRSANRGECAQACRMPYKMIVDGKALDLGSQSYLLSPQDLMGIEYIPDLIRLGVASFKIEGRLKAPEYVANVTRQYRKAIDQAWDGLKVDLSKDEKYELEMAFSRGLYPGWFEGVNHQELVHGRFGKKRGVLMGSVVRVDREAVIVLTDQAIKAGDGLVFEESGEATNHEQGGRVWHVERVGHQVKLEFERGKLNFSRINPGVRVWKTDDPVLNKKWRDSFQNPRSRRKRKINYSVCDQGGKLKAVATCGRHSVETESTMPLEVATGPGLNLEILEKQLGRLGDTFFELGSVENFLPKGMMLPLSELNRMRRDLAAELTRKVSENPGYIVNEGALVRLTTSDEKAKSPATEQVTLSVLCRDETQIEGALESGVENIYLDFEDVRKYKSAVSKIRSSGNSFVVIAPPRIFKPGESAFLKLVDDACADGILVRNFSTLAYFKKASRPYALLGDFSLNVANQITAQHLIKQIGFTSLTLSYDLHVEEVLNVLRESTPAWFELTLHQHMPMFHMEHCAFAAFLSKGTDSTNCGRPCEKHKVELQDRVGQKHPLKADVGCRNTLYNAAAQSGAEFYAQFYQAGLRRFRLELVNESKDESCRVIGVYQDLIAGKIDAQKVWKSLQVVNQLGVTRGTLSA
ncbi:MAG: U32 family peptidase [Verrucomicrobiota bacterium]|nr:U32 family peptidase [Verrucomicrobiota bacterium]